MSPPKVKSPGGRPGQVLEQNSKAPCKHFTTLGVIPEPVRELPHFICWGERQTDNGKPAKLPRDPKTGYNINAQDPSNWMSFDDAVSACRSNPDLAGIGVVLTESDNITGIDMDSCVDPLTGEIEAWAQEHIDVFNSYTEISPSGTGVRILVKGKPPKGHPCKDGRREIYSKGRFLTLTGNCIAGEGVLAESPDAVNQYIASMTAKRLAQSDQSSPQEIIEGDRNTTLASLAGAMRRKGFGEESIEAALLVHNEQFCEPPLDDDEVKGIARSIAKYEPSDPIRPEVEVDLPIVNFNGLEDLHIDPPDEIVKGLLPVDVASGLGSNGGVGKSQAGLQLAACVAAGIPFMGLDTVQAPVTFYSAEDDGRVLLGRLKRILRRYDIDSSVIADQLQLIDATAIDPALFREAYVDNSRRGVTTPAYDALMKVCRANGSRLLIVDNVSDVFEANENERQRVRQFVRTVANIARALNGAVLLLTHVDKATVRGGGSGGSGYSGSTAWNNSVRSRMFMRRDSDTGVITLEHQKANYGPLMNDIEMSWVDGVLVQGVHVDPLAEVAEDYQARWICEAILERTARGASVSTCRTGLNAYSVLKDVDDFPKSLEKSVFWRLLDRLEKQELVIRETYHDGKGRVKERFNVTAKGREYCEVMD